jgi:peptidyl-prolyl cis-trans isomerase D
MISWMQKHNKYLVWTIWVASIAFIGAGFVGWGSYDFSSRAGSIAKVGDISISQNKLNRVYSNLYNQYNQQMQGKLDEETAKRLGLVQQAFSTVALQAKILNFAKDNGIIVSDEEVAQKLQEIPIFQDKNVFNKEIFDRFVESQRMTAQEFEESLREDLIITKALALINSNILPYEEKIISSAFGTADQLDYIVLTPEDINVSVSDDDVKAFWETQKENFKTQKAYNLQIVWTSSDETDVTEAELQSHYTTNSFNYTDEKGSQLTFEEAKDQVTKDLKIKKSKKRAQRAYIAFKKGETEATEVLTLSINDPKLSSEIWEEIAQKAAGDILKPKVVTDRYATVKVAEIIPPRTMTYEEAKPQVTALFTAQAKTNLLNTKAEEVFQHFDESNATTSEFLSLNQNVNLDPLNQQESLQFVQKLFTSTKEKGMISISDNIVIYKVREQKVLELDAEERAYIKATASQLKQRTFENNLLKMLDSKYPTEVYAEGLVN